MSWNASYKEVAYERPMTTWVVVPADAIAEDPELSEWLSLGLQAIL